MTTTDDHRYAAAHDLLMLESQTDVGGILENLEDDQRIAAVRIITSTIKKPGTIDKIRKLVNSEKFDYPKP